MKEKKKKPKEVYEFRSTDKLIKIILENLLAIQMSNTS